MVVMPVTSNLTHYISFHRKQTEGICEIAPWSQGSMGNDQDHGLGV